jgi:hypothetical protein
VQRTNTLLSELSLWSGWMSEGQIGLQLFCWSYISSFMHFYI